MFIKVNGIVANYFTKLEFHIRNPHLEFDMIKEVVKHFHEERIILKGHFDFCNLNEELAVRKPGD